MNHAGGPGSPVATGTGQVMKSTPWGEPAVRAWEEPLTIPTYCVGEPDDAPIFYSGSAYQGAERAVYPYPLLDDLTDIREDRTYRAVYLENQFIKVCVLPEIGGRIFSAVDKTNGYDFFYHQHVIKPALIGMLGAWISGGVEWNVPHHHRATTFMPVDYTVEDHPDGGKTIWIGEIELRHRMRWGIGLTLYPDCSYIEAAISLFNATPFAHSFLFLANSAVHAGEDYQVIFPPRTQLAVSHGKTEFSRWPVSHSVFDGVDYSRGVDVSWWKNHPAPISWFCWESDEDFFGGYDHGRQAGVVHVADHRVVRGKKFWEWGTGPEADLWYRILTETDGPYIEMLAGAYSDNLPDYSWIQPYERKVWKQCWYPLRQIGGIKNANLRAAVNLDVNLDGVASLAFNTTAEHSGARAALEAGGQVLVRETIDIGPGNPYSKEIPLPAGIDPQSLKAVLLDSEGSELIGYTPVRLAESPVPEPIQAPLAPRDIETTEELYLTGLRLEQFHNPMVAPDAYFEEALRRDPGDTRVNTEVGIRLCKRGLFREAEEHLSTALRRLTHNYTSPRNGEAFYYRGVSLEGQGRDDSAFDAYAQAALSASWRAASCYALARLATRKRQLATALEFVEASLHAGGLNLAARDLRAALLRLHGDPRKAARAAREVLSMDPLDFRAANELYLAQLASEEPAEAEQTLRALALRMRGETQSYLETALDYGAAGLWDDAVNLLLRLVYQIGDSTRVHPMVWYYLAHYSARLGKHDEVSYYRRLASQAPADFCFPFRLESIGVLRRAAEANPEDARAPYYLGNLLYDLQPQEAVRAWERARQLDDSFAMVHRNLGLAYFRVEHDLDKALAALEAASALQPDNPRFLYELDLVSEAANLPAAKRLQRLEDNQALVLRRDDLVARQVRLQVLQGRHDDALAILTSRHFHAAEGGGEIRDVWVELHLRRGERFLKQGQPGQALRDFQAARTAPPNLEIAEPYRDPRRAEIEYYTGLAREALEDSAGARQAFERAAAASAPEMPEALYYQALALRKLGRREQADSLCEELIRTGKELEANEGADYFAKFGDKLSGAQRQARAHRLQSLGLQGKGQFEIAGGDIDFPA